MKRIALLLLSVSSVTVAAEPVYYTNGSSICVRLGAEVVAFEIDTPKQTHSILGRGAATRTSAGYEFTFTDSFGNSGSGSVNHEQQLKLWLTEKGKHSPSAVLAAYGSYTVHQSVCGSNALRLSQGVEVQLAVQRDDPASGGSAR
jgi:hypothetical protein